MMKHSASQSGNPLLFSNVQCVRLRAALAASFEHNGASDEELLAQVPMALQSCPAFKPLFDQGTRRRLSRCCLSVLKCLGAYRERLSVRPPYDISLWLQCHLSLAAVTSSDRNFNLGIHPPEAETQGSVDDDQPGALAKVLRGLVFAGVLECRSPVHFTLAVPRENDGACPVPATAAAEAVAGLDERAASENNKAASSVATVVADLDALCNPVGAPCPYPQHRVDSIKACGHWRLAAIGDVEATLERACEERLLERGITKGTYALPGTRALFPPGAPRRPTISSGRPRDSHGAQRPPK
jgi:hypothetical protein